MKPEKLVDLLTTLSALQVKLLDMDKDAKDARRDALIEENKRLKSELAARPTDEDIQVKIMLAQLKGSDSGRLKQLEAEIEALKSQSVTLHAENTELAKTNNSLKSENSQLVEQAQKLQQTNSDLELTITTLESRTVEELLAEARAKNVALATALSSAKL
jgi:FtsZ-binding cell division protein ZapB